MILANYVYFMKGPPGSDGGGLPRRPVRRGQEGRVEAPRGSLMGIWTEGHFVAADRGKWGVLGCIAVKRRCGRKIPGNQKIL